MRFTTSTIQAITSVPGADPGGCNRCVSNGQIFLIKMLIYANLAIPSARIAQYPQSSSYNLVFKFMIKNYSII